MTNINPTDFDKKPPWKRARQLESERAAEFITIAELLERLRKLDNLRDRALVSVLYLTAARIQEVVKYRKIRYKTTGKKGSKRQLFNEKWVGKPKPGMSQKDISIDRINNRKILKIKLRNLKNKKTQTKIIPIPLDREEYHPFIKAILAHKKTLFEWEEELFPISKRRAEKILEKIGFNPHFLRKLRLTHLAKYNHFTEQELQLYAGWSNGIPAQAYVRLGVTDLLNSL